MVAVLLGALLGLLTIVKVFDMGFLAVLARPFDPVLDWYAIMAGVEFVDSSVGGAAAVGAVVAAVAAAGAVIALMALSVRRLARVAARHATTASRTLMTFGVVWVTCVLLGVQIAPDVPLAANGTATLAYDHGRQMVTGLQDQRAFAAEAADDAFADTPDEELLTALRGKDVVLAFIESYGRDAVQNPRFEPEVGAVLDEGESRLNEAGFTSQSAFLTSSTVGGSSWLAHATMLSGLWIDNQQRYRNLVTSDRLTLTGAFQRAGWQTAAMMPGVDRAWPEGGFFGYDRIYPSQELGYRGPPFSWSNMPDQYTLSAFERLERANPDRDSTPLMADIPLISSHAPWDPIPELIDWDDIGDGSVYESMATESHPIRTITQRDPEQVRDDYRKAVEYSLNSLISYAETYGDEDLVLIFLGDHQPSPVVTGEDASRDVPITIVSGDPDVFDHISDWKWQDGLHPDAQAPTWRMDAFRDRFLTAFGPQS
ncbi:alkaline phosphatase family protein [Allosalinactinospora lopnorensis]|uniref:sulfatase n=1 Tax=Allosalinactinospora lopnorensis TaxID=1352348 RepID=UPI00138ECE6D|nr:sulfatase [Allosalinactinospora lopnorensis]